MFEILMTTLFYKALILQGLNLFMTEPSVTACVDHHPLHDL